MTDQICYAIVLFCAGVDAAFTFVAITQRRIGLAVVMAIITALTILESTVIHGVFA